MPRIYLVRHAKPAAAWGDDPDPGLDALGATQAAAVAQQLASITARMPVYTSPLRRCRETAVPLCELWQCDGHGAAVGRGNSIAAARSRGAARMARRQAMRGTWHELHERAPAGSIDYLEWRRSVVDSLIALPHDCVIFTHLHRDQRRGRRCATARGSRVLPAGSRIGHGARDGSAGLAAGRARSRSADRAC